MSTTDAFGLATAARLSLGNFTHTMGSLRAEDRFGNPVAGAPVVFRVTAPVTALAPRGVAVTNQPLRNAAFDAGLVGRSYGVSAVRGGPGRPQVDAVVIATDTLGLAEAPVMLGNLPATQYRAAATIGGLGPVPFDASTFGFALQDASDPLGARDYYRPVVAFATAHRPAQEAGLAGMPIASLEQAVYVLREDVEYDAAGAVVLDTPGMTVRGNRTVSVSRRELGGQRVQFSESSGTGIFAATWATLDALDRATTSYTAGSASPQTIVAEPPATGYAVGVVLSSGVLAPPAALPPGVPAFSLAPLGSILGRVSVFVLELVLPRGDPTSSPDDTNELVFDASALGLLEGRALVRPLGIGVTPAVIRDLNEKP